MRIRLLLPLLLSAAPVVAFDAVSALSYYMDEVQGHLLVSDLPDDIDVADLRADISRDGQSIVRGVPLWQARHPAVLFPLASLPMGASRVQVRLSASGRNLGMVDVPIVRRASRQNAVQVDRLSGGLLVDGREFLPFGFYCYSPVQPTLAEEEVVRGFNLMSPYQSNDPTTIDERRAWMDRAAALGMKVHYQLLQVAGGGGVNMGNARLDTAATRRNAWLRAEVEAFRDHPALLAWYISDEPTGHGATPEQLEAAASIVRELDPYHPVSIVFVNPSAAAQFAGAMDLAMTDPYPIPNGSPASVTGAVRTILDAVSPEIPLWLVPQAFGGNEFWSREPTAAELRLMTWLGLIEGATGVQYFIRHGLNGFPKSPDTWAAAGRVALEAQELTPFLLSRDAAPTITVDTEGVRAAAWAVDGDVIVAVANTSRQPQEMELTLEGISWSRDAVDVLYEDRVVPLERPRSRGGFTLLRRPFDLVGDVLRDDPDDEVQLTDWIDGYGVRLYSFARNATPTGDPDNLLVDPSFEWNPTPSVPAAVYAAVEKGRGATYFTDSRVVHQGRRSLRLHSPSPSSNLRLRPYSPSIVPGRSYRFALWARADRPGVALRMINSAAGDSLQVELTDIWQRYELDAVVKPTSSRAWLSFGLASAGTAWIDDLSFFDISPEIQAVATPMGHSLSLSAPIDGTTIHYRLDGADVTADDPIYAEPVRTDGPSQLRVGLVRDSQVLSRADLDLYHHAALGRFVELTHPYSPRYTAAGPGALADGILGTDRFTDGRWQGFEGKDLIAVIDLGRDVRVEAVRMRFLQSVGSWIWLPRVLEVNLSSDGKTFRPYATVDHAVDERRRDTVIETLEVRGTPDTARFVRVRARSMGRCPQWHPGAGGPAWVFADEIVVEGR